MAVPHTAFCGNCPTDRPPPPPRAAALPSLVSYSLAFSSSLRAFAGDPACLHPGRAPRPRDAGTRPGQSATARRAKRPGRSGMPAGRDRGPPRRARAWQGLRASLHPLPWSEPYSRDCAARTGRMCWPCHCALRPAGVGWRRVAGAGWGVGGGGGRGDAGCGTERRVREKKKRV